MIVFYATDESFDYPTGYGYDTCHETGLHGIEFFWDFDEETETDFIDLEAIEGFGHFDNDKELNRAKTSWAAMVEFLETYSHYDEYYTDTDDYDVLLSYAKSQITKAA